MRRKLAWLVNTRPKHTAVVNTLYQVIENTYTGERVKTENGIIKHVSA